MEVDHVSERAVRERGAEHGDVVLMAKTLNALHRNIERESIHFVRPVIYRFLVVNLLAQSPDERTR